MLFYLLNFRRGWFLSSWSRFVSQIGKQEIYSWMFLAERCWMNVTGVSRPFYRELYQLAPKSCAFSLHHPVQTGWGQHLCWGQAWGIYVHKRGVCVCLSLYVHTHADYKSTSRAPLIIWWILQLYASSQHHIDYIASEKFPAPRLREGGETFQSSCFGNKCSSFLSVFPAPCGDVCRLPPHPIVQLTTIKLLFFHFFFQLWWLTN